jgi:spore coat protein U-like protein
MWKRRKAMMAVNKILCIPALSILAAFAPVYADDNIGSNSVPCQLELTATDSIDARGPFGRGYDVFIDEQGYENLAITVRHMGAACRYNIVVSHNNQTSPILAGPSQSLSYDILKTTNGPSALSRDYYGSESARIEGQFGPGNASAETNLIVSLPAGQFVRSGSYSGQIIVRLFKEEDGGGYTLAAEAPVFITTRVSAAMKITSDSFPGATRYTDVDLGELAYGTTKSVEFSLASNAAVAVDFRSANQGMLKHHAGARSIAYRLNAQGHNIDLQSAGSNLRVATGSGQTPAPIRLEINVPASSSAPAAGIYKDILTVTFTVEE